MNGPQFGRAMAAAALIAVSVGFGSGSVGVSRAAPRLAGGPDGDLVEVAVNVGTLTRLLAALRAADRVALLREGGPRTLFAPGDDAFAKLPAGALDELLRPENVEKLRALLLRHIVPGVLAAADLKPGDLSTLGGERLAVARDPKSGALTVAGARIVKADRTATNGVLHVIDRVLMPASSP